MDKEEIVKELNKEEDLFWCPRCEEFKYCPRGSCEAKLVGKIVTTAIIGEFKK